MSDRVAAAEGKVSELASDVSIWRSFMEHAGWVKLDQILEEQFKTRITMVGLTPLESMSKVLAQEFMKGEANAYGALRALPATLLEQARAAMTTAEVQLDQEKEHVSSEAKARSTSRVDDRDFSRE